MRPLCINSPKKTLLSRVVRWLRESLKKSCAFGARHLFGKQSYRLFGVPVGLTEGLISAGTNKQIFFPAHRLGLQPPQTLHPPLYPEFAESVEKGVAISEQGMLSVGQATATYTGGNLSVESKLITTFLQLIDNKLPHQHDLFRFTTRAFFPKIYHTDQPVVTLAAMRQRAFYHWIFDVLVRLFLVERAGCHNLLIYIDNSLNYQQESLELLGLSSSQILSVNRYAAVVTPQLFVPSTPEFATQWGCEFLRGRILPKLHKHPPLRLYISRSDAPTRRLLNEEILWSQLQAVGFQRVLLTELTFKQQAELFHAAEVIVAPHGAGLSHLVFCQSGTKLLEIFSPHYFNSCYWHLAHHVGVHYHYLFGCPSSHLPGELDMVMDPATFAAALNSLL